MHNVHVLVRCGSPGGHVLGPISRFLSAAGQQPFEEIYVRPGKGHPRNAEESRLKLFFGHSIVVGAATPTLPRLRFRHRGTTACENSNESGARGRERAWPYGINRQTSRGSRPCGEGLAHNLQHTPSVQLLWHVVRGQDRFCELPGCLIQPTEPFLRPKNGRNLSKCGQCVDCRTPSQASAELRKAILNP